MPKFETELTEDLKNFIKPRSGARWEFKLPSLDTHTNQLADFLEMVQKIISWSHPNIARERVNAIYMSFYEALANASYHGNGGDRMKSVLIGLWIGENGIAFSFQDEGDFFHNQKNKRTIESRQSIPSSEKNSSGFGMNYIYAADVVFVCLKRSTLYFAFKA